MRNTENWQFKLKFLLTSWIKIDVFLNGQIFNPIERPSKPKPVREVPDSAKTKELVLGGATRADWYRQSQDLKLCVRVSFTFQRERIYAEW
jgi:hypothetical protein